MQKFLEFRSFSRYSLLSLSLISHYPAKFFINFKDSFKEKSTPFLGRSIGKNVPIWNQSKIFFYFFAIVNLAYLFPSPFKISEKQYLEQILDLEENNVYDKIYHPNSVKTTSFTPVGDFEIYPLLSLQFVYNVFYPVKFRVNRLNSEVYKLLNF